jgi:putative tryptophan/tyrosine transport system substrate-binding protein
MFGIRWRGAISTLLGAVVLAWVPLAADAQQPAKVPRLGWLGNNSPTFPPYQRFREGLRELGYIEGKTISIEARWAAGNLDRLPALASELVRLNVDVLFVAGDQGLKAAKEATATIPIVVAACDPLDALVASIARPGGKATGLTCVSSELASKRLQLLKELVPALARVAVLYNPEDRNKVPEYKQLDEAAGKMNLTLRPLEARTASEIDSVFVGLAEQVQGLIALADPIMNFHVKKLAGLALKNSLPAVYGFREFAEAGGLMSHGASLHWLYRRAAWYVDKILKGANPGELPIEQPTRFELVINLRTAKALGITLPPTLYALANDLIE